MTAFITQLAVDFAHRYKRHIANQSIELPGENIAAVSKIAPLPYPVDSLYIKDSGQYFGVFKFPGMDIGQGTMALFIEEEIREPVQPVRKMPQVAPATKRDVSAQEPDCGHGDFC